MEAILDEPVQFFSATREKQPVLPLLKQLQLCIVVWLPRKKWDNAKKKKGVGWGALFDVCQGSLEQRDDRTNEHTSAPLLAACLPCLRSKLARREQRGLDVDGEVVPFPLAPYFVAMSVGTNHRAVFMFELHTHTAHPMEGDVTC